MSAAPRPGRERWDEIQRLFAEALDLPGDDRDGWLRQATDDPVVRDEVVSLLAAHARVTGPLDGPLPLLADGLAREEPLRPGDRLGPYEIAATLGRGGMGVVYVAHDSRLGRDVAVKLLAPGLASDPRALRRFEREGRAVAALAHPNIVSLFDVGQEGERAYAVMELLEGETLRQRLERGPLAVREALRVARDVARGLAAAHAKGLVHRDLKPDNVVLAPAGAKILDFGIARVTEESEVKLEPAAADAAATTAAGTALAGTAGYLSPEQARREPADARSDVFAFGCVLYECLAGRRAFDARDLHAAVDAVLRDEPTPLRRLRPDVSKALAAIVERCLRKAATERFASGRELAAALEPLAADAEVADRRRARQRLAASLVTFALVVAAAAAYGYRLWRNRDIVPGTPGGLVFRKNPVDGAQYSRIPPGTFGMGCDPGSHMRRVLPCDARSQPYFQVTLSRPYWMMRTEVTRSEFAAYAKATGAAMPGAERLDPLPPRMATLWKSLASRPDNPMVLVNWHEASAYCAWAGSRLPSEAEWERAARANHEWDFVWGVQNLGPGTAPLANVRDESRYRKYGPHVRDDGREDYESYYKGYDDGFPDLAPVGSFPPNDFGLYDMGGNVWEWTLDDGPAAFQVPSYDGHPADGSPRRGWDGSAHVIRGSGWDYGPTAQTVWIRDVGSAYGHGYMLGFRCVRDTPP